MIRLMNFSPSRSSRALRSLLVCLLITSCGGVISSCGASAPSDAQQASDALNAGLNAQIHGQTAEAVADYQKVIAKDPHNKYAYYNLGLIDQGEGQNATAEANYRTALQIDPNFAEALYNLAILRTAPSPQEAVDLYGHAISVKPNFAAAYLNLGFLLISLGQVDVGKADLDRAVLLDPSLKARIPTPSPSPSRKP
jgi:tetratricopeptide (TPR) repeat protein